MEVSQDFAKVMDKDELIDQTAVQTLSRKLEKIIIMTEPKPCSFRRWKSYIAAPISGWVQGIWYDKENYQKLVFRTRKLG